MAHRSSLLLGLWSLFSCVCLGEGVSATDGEQTRIRALVYGIELFEAEAFEEARQYFSRVVAENPMEARAHFYLGRSYLELQDTDKSIKHLNQAIELDGRSSEYFRWLGRGYAQQAMNSSIFAMRGIARRSLAAIDKAIELDPENVEARFDRTQYFVVLPGILGGSTKTALQETMEIQQRDPIRGHMALGMVRASQKQWDAAEAAYLAALGIRIDHVPALYELGLLYQQRGRFAEAHYQFAKAITVDPSFVEALYQFGKTSALSGQRLDDGVKHLSAYIGMRPLKGPGAANACWRLGMVYEHQHDFERARGQYEQALILDPDHKQAKKASRKLK